MEDLPKLDAAPEPAEQLLLKACDAQGAITEFKIRPTTKFAKLFRAIAEQKGVNKDMLRFMFDGERLKENETPVMKRMQNGDTIDIMLEQIGGCPAFQYGMPPILPACRGLYITLF